MPLAMPYACAERATGHVDIGHRRILLSESLMQTRFSVDPEGEAGTRQLANYNYNETDYKYREAVVLNRGINFFCSKCYTANDNLICTLLRHATL